MGRKRQYSWDEIVSLYLEGKSPDDISELIGMSKSGITAILRKRGIKIRTTKKNTDYDQLYAEHLDGHSLTELSIKYGISVPTISICFKLRGWSVVRRNKSKADKNE